MPTLQNSNISRFVSDVTEAYDNGDFKKCLYLALKYFNSGAGLNEIQNNIAVLRIIRFSAEALIDKIQGETKHVESALKEEVCSFCFKSGKDIQFFNGVNIRICHECVKTMHNLIVKDKE
jgi:hypothetical protein